MAFGSVSEAVKAGADYFRLEETVITSNPTFDMFDGSCVAIQIGPDSDIAGMEFTYLDPNRPTTRGTLTVEAGAPFPTRLDAQMDQKYRSPPGAVGNIIGKALINLDATILASAHLDLFFFLRDPVPSFAQLRKNDYQRLRHTFSVAGVEQRVLIRPYYGRQSFDLQLLNQDLASTVDWRVIGHRFRGIAGDNIVILLGSGTLAAGQALDFAISGRRYDAIEIFATSNNAASGEILSYAYEASDRCCGPAGSTFVLPDQPIPPGPR
jgi:hypothetical protein